MKAALRILTWSALLLSVGASNACATSEGKGKCPIHPSSVHSTKEAEALALEAAAVYKLSPIPLKCVSYTSGNGGGKNDQEGPYWVAFHENHTPECGGDPRTGPRLFTITVTSKGLMKTDAYGDSMASGKFLRLRCPKRTR